MNIYQCPECGIGFSSGTKFCQNCGYKLQMEVVSPICPECGKIFPTGTKFCSEDGAELLAPEMLIPCCEKCGKEYTNGEKFCPECGGKIVSLFCPEEGAKLVSPEKQTSRCVKCGIKYTDGTKFCPECGGKVVCNTSKLPPNKNGNTHCEKCGKEITGETKFCDECGGKVVGDNKITDPLPEPMPETYQWQSIVIFILCIVPLGLILTLPEIFWAGKIKKLYLNGNIEAAKQLSKRSRNSLIWSVICTLVFWIIVLTNLLN